MLKGSKHKPESLILMSVNHSGGNGKGWHHTEEARKKLSESHKGQKAWNKGRKLTPEERLKLSQVIKLGMTQEVRDKVSKALTGRKNPEHSLRMKGRKLTEEHKLKIKQGLDRHGPNCSCKAHKPFVVEKKPSKQQLEIASIIESLGYKTIIEQPFDRCSVDIYLPELHLGIEYDGEYWHKDRKHSDHNRDLFLKHTFNLPIIRISEKEYKSWNIEEAESAMLKKIGSARLKKIIEGRI